LAQAGLSSLHLIYTTSCVQETDRTRPAAGKPLGFFREGTMNEQLLQIIIDIAIIVLRVFAAGMAD